MRWPMSVSANIRCTAFDGTRRIASGDLAHVAAKAKESVDRGGHVLLFDDDTSQTIEVDFRGTPEDVAKRLAAPAGHEAVTAPRPGEVPQRGPGRPRLGVVAREVTL